MRPRRTGCGFDGFEAGVVELADGVRANRFEDILDGQILSVEMAGRDGAAVEHERGDIEPCERHHSAGHVLVAAGDGDEAVEEIPARDQFYRVGDDFTADQRSLHAFGAHGDAVGDGDGVELHRRAAGFADALLHRFGDMAQVEVAGADLGPRIRDADDGLVQVFFREADSAKHGARGSAMRSFGKGNGVQFGIMRAVLAVCAHACGVS